MNTEQLRIGFISGILSTGLFIMVDNMRNANAIAGIVSTYIFVAIFNIIFDVIWSKSNNFRKILYKSVFKTLVIWIILTLAMLLLIQTFRKYDKSLNA